MPAPAVPTVEVQNVSIGVVRVRVTNKDADFYRIYRGTAKDSTTLRIDDLDGRTWAYDTVTEDTLYYYRARGVNIDVVDEAPVEAVSAYGADQGIKSINDTYNDNPDDPTNARLLAVRSGLTGTG